MAKLCSKIDKYELNLQKLPMCLFFLHSDELSSKTLILGSDRPEKFLLNLTE